MAKMLSPAWMKGVYEKIEIVFKNKQWIAGKSGRHMKFPYTLSAKIAQFPYFHYLKNNNIWMYYPFGLALAFYLISYIHVIVNSEENKISWAESQRKSAETHH